MNFVLKKSLSTYAIGVLLTCSFFNSSLRADLIESFSAQVSADNSLIVNFNVRTKTPTKVFVEYENAQAGKFTSALSSVSGTCHTFNVFRFRPCSTYCYRIVAVDENGIEHRSEKKTIKTGELPQGLNAIIFDRVKTPFTTELMFIAIAQSPLDPDFFNGIIALDSEGYIVWFVSIPITVQGFEQQPDFNMLITLTSAQFSLASGALISPTGKFLLETSTICSVNTDLIGISGPPPPPNIGQGGAHHAIFLSNPKEPQFFNKVVKYLGRVLRDPFFELPITNPLHAPAGSRLQQGDTIREWNPAQNTDVVRWSAFDFINPITNRAGNNNTATGAGGSNGRLAIPTQCNTDQIPLGGNGPDTKPFPFNGNFIQNWIVTNNLQQVSDGYILDLRFLSQIMKVTLDYQDITWVMGNEIPGIQSRLVPGAFNKPVGTFITTDARSQFFVPHTARQLLPGEPTIKPPVGPNQLNILMFDNGAGRPNTPVPFSRALEVQIDLTTKLATFVWEWSGAVHTPRLFSGSRSGAARLQNGNTLILFGIDDLFPHTAPCLESPSFSDCSIVPPPEPLCCQTEWRVVEAGVESNSTVAELMLLTPSQGIGGPANQAVPATTIFGEKKVS